MTGEEETRLVRTVCPAHCGIDACGILAHVKGDRVVKVEPAEFPDPKYRRICLRGLASLDITYHPDRLRYPMKRVGERGEGKFKRISWDEALDTIAEKFKDIAGKYGWRSIGWTLGGPGAGTTKFGAYLRLAGLTQSTRVSAWGYGDAGLPCGSRILFGTHFPGPLVGRALLAGTDVPELVLVWGANPGETQPLNMMRRLMDLKEEGALLVVIDPRFTVTASKADVYIGLKPGTDAALALGIMHVIFRNGHHDEAFIRRHTVGPYLVRMDTEKFLRANEIGISDSQEYVIWDKHANAPKVRGDSSADVALTGTYRIHGIECRPSLQLLMDLAKEYPPEKTSEITGIQTETIARLGERLGTAKTVSFATHMGLTRTFHGDISLRALGTVAAITGNISVTSRAGHRPAVLNW